MCVGGEDEGGEMISDNFLVICVADVFEATQNTVHYLVICLQKLFHHQNIHMIQCKAQIQY